jgi:hypothetical protein
MNGFAQALPNHYTITPKGKLPQRKPGLAAMAARGAIFLIYF